MNAWLVILDGEVIDTVFFDSDMDAWDVKHALVNHDGLSQHIRVMRKN